MLNSQARLRLNKPEVLAEIVENQAIIINQSTDVYYRLDRVGNLIWSMFCESYSVESIAGVAADFSAIAHRTLTREKHRACGSDQGQTPCPSVTVAALLPQNLRYPY